MTPSNLTILNSVREFQKHFNQAFNVAKAQNDQTYTTTQTINGGLIICRNFTVNAGVTLTISNPTTIVCQTFTNNGTITMSAVNESVLHAFRNTDSPEKPRLYRPLDTANFAPFSGGQHLCGGSGGASFGFGGHAGVSGATTTQFTTIDGVYCGLRSLNSNGWKQVGIAYWWPIAVLRNPVLSVGGGFSSPGKPSFACSLAFQTKGGEGTNLGNSAATFPYISGAGFSVGGNPGSFLEVFAQVSFVNSSTGIINATGAVGGGPGNASGGGGGGGGVGIYSEGFLTQAGTINANGGNGTAGSGGGACCGGGGGGGGIFLTAPTITNTGTNNVAGGSGATGVSQGFSAAGQAGVVVVEPYLRLWMPGEDDVVVGTRYDAT